MKNDVEGSSSRRMPVRQSVGMSFGLCLMAVLPSCGLVFDALGEALLPDKCESRRDKEPPGHIWSLKSSRGRRCE